jgi:hypothetical protein
MSPCVSKSKNITINNIYPIGFPPDVDKKKEKIGVL